jgi:hypothetical protein
VLAALDFGELAHQFPVAAVEVAALAASAAGLAPGVAITGHTTMDEVSHERRQAIVLAARSVILALNIGRLVVILVFAIGPWANSTP